MESTRNSSTDTSNSQKLPSDLKELNKVYEGTEDDLANLAITLRTFLHLWEKRHPGYSHYVRVKDNQLHLNITKID